jgi:prolyl 4-hydroxylase
MILKQNNKIMEIDIKLINKLINNILCLKYFIPVIFIVLIGILYFLCKSKKIFIIGIVSLLTILTILTIYYYYLIENPILKYIKNISDENYSIIHVKNMLSDIECDQFLKYIYDERKIFEESKVYLNDKSIVTDYRKSKQLWLKDKDHKICKKITKIAEIFTGKSPKYMEDLQLVEYDVSGYFKKHYDPTVNEKNSNINDRAYTLLIYLNNVEDGGETYFEKINLEIKPQKGDCIFFKSLDENTEKIISKSLHQGMNVKKGKKIICNKWIHLHKFSMNQ